MQGRMYRFQGGMCPVRGGNRLKSSRNKGFPHDTGAVGGAGPAGDASRSQAVRKFSAQRDLFRLANGVRSLFLVAEDDAVADVIDIESSGGANEEALMRATCRSRRRTRRTHARRFARRTSLPGAMPACSGALAVGYNGVTGFRSSE
jgi:hypothetical protein